MADMNIDFTGFVTKDPETRDVGQHRVTEVTVAWTERRKDKTTGEWADFGDPTWITAPFWNEHGDAVAAAVRKGSPVHITATGFTVRPYLKNDGTPGAGTQLVNPTIAVTIPRPKRGGNTQQGGFGGQASNQAWPATPAAGQVPGVAAAIQQHQQAAPAWNDQTPF